MESQQLLTEGEVFQDEILAGTRSHLVRPTAKSLVLRVRDVLTSHR